MKRPIHIPPNASRPGFTLIEVLIAILILALGLLGLGAVFPVVISQQRDAVQTVDGESVASMAASIVRSSTETIDFTPWFNPAHDMGKHNSGDTFSTYEWIVGPLEPYNDYQQRPGFVNDNHGPPSFDGSQDGYWYTELALLDTPPTTAATLSHALSVADRLFPQPFSGQDPKYVWDIVVRREPISGRPQVGIFIRQIDSRISVPKDQTLSDVLVLRAASPSANSPSLPVALDKNTGRPVVDNAGDNNDNIVYAAPQTLQVQVVEDHLDWLIFEDAGNPFIDTSIGFATQPGQKLLDNTGTVRTVLGLATGPDSDILNTRIVRVDPPFKPSQAAVDAASYGEDENNPLNDALNDDAQRASWVRQVVFTPRTPVAIRVVTLEEPKP